MENLLITLGPWAISLAIVIVGYFIKEYIRDTKEEFRTFKKQLLINSREHREIMVHIARLTEHLPNIVDCEEDLAKLNSSDSKQWSKLSEHDVKITEHGEKLKRLVA